MERVNGPPDSRPKQTKYSDLLTDDLDARDELRERELEEARARAAQMEKTMRWWSDCTANWREKWGKVRAERNKAREENRQLKLKLEAALKEVSNLKRERQDSSELKAKLEKELERLEKELRKDKRLVPSARVEPSYKGDLIDSVDGKPGKTDASSIYEKTVPKLGAEKQFIEQILQKKELYEASSGHDGGLERNERQQHLGSQKHKLRQEIETNGDIAQKVVVLRVKLEETQKLLQDERSSKTNLMEEIDSLQVDLNSMRIKFEELKMGKDAVQAELARVKEKYNRDTSSLTSNLEDAYSSSDSGATKKIKDLRLEIERLQAENTMEWSKREQLETEKITLDRENKKLKHQIEDLESQLSHKTARASHILDSDMKQLQLQLEERNKEIGEVRYSYNKAKKQLQEKTDELDHATSRIEQHENEVRKLRSRVEELKKEHARAEDEIDLKENTVRKLQRTLDEQTEYAESLKVHLEHLKSRMRMNTVTGVTSKKPGMTRSCTVPASSEDSDDDFGSL